MTVDRGTPLSSTRDPVAFWLAIASTVLLVFAVFNLVQTAMVPTRWAGVVLWAIAAVAYAALGIVFWASARATVWIEDGRVIRGGVSGRHGRPVARGAFGWSLPVTPGLAPEVRTLLGRPYLVLAQSDRTDPVAALRETPRADRSLAQLEVVARQSGGWLSRAFLWHRTPPRSAIAPLDPAAVDCVRAAL
ncbi:hypothetical protein [Microbacterium sediminis]|uniref:Uncharacterized protein n=1 Tax=Microbacterium sediminis TaxID=904291 RepID=A0A1B9N9H4_9MICO|nr:hypothetical protein [Microbacterium sediminis]OCG73258.1 hypothetical protein A7J15_08105 [Microbacterium sediminis]QBR75147.1 hypothetical protein E3O41_12565 [Microbacterium sediminis]